LFPHDFEQVRTGHETEIEWSIAEWWEFVALANMVDNLGEYLAAVP
jgi:hypothetical protein